MDRALTENNNNDSIVIWAGENTFKIPSQLAGFCIVINNKESGLYRLIFKMNNGYENMDRELMQSDFEGYDSGSGSGFGSGDSDSNCDVGSGSGYGGGYGSDFVNGFGYSFGPGDCQGKSSGYDRIKFREFWFYNKNPIIR